jgi:hypothetical protein
MPDRIIFPAIDGRNFFIGSTVRVLASGRIMGMMKSRAGLAFKRAYVFLSPFFHMPF